MAFQIGGDDVIGDVAGCSREVTPRPEPLPPIPLPDVLEFLLDASGRTAFSLLDELADRDVRRYPTTAGFTNSVTVNYNY